MEEETWESILNVLAFVVIFATVVIFVLLATGTIVL